MTASLSLPALRRRLAAAHQLLVRPQQSQAQLLPVTIQSPERLAAPIQGHEQSAHSVVRMVPPQEIQIDPLRFQFRLSAVGDGTTGRLKGAPRFSLPLAGALLVWMDPADHSGPWLVDGHHRLSLALADGVPLVAVLEIAAPEARAARIAGAMANVANGTAAATDLARLIRDQQLEPRDLPKLFAIPRNTRALADATALIALDPALFSTCCNGLLPLDHALALASCPDHQTQQQLWAMAQSRSWDANQLLEAAVMALPSASTAVVECLPGFEELLAEANPLIDEQLSIRAAIRLSLRIETRAMRIAADRRAAAMLEGRGVAAVDRDAAQIARQESTALLSVFSRLSGTSGPLAELIKELAALVSDEMPAAAVVEQNLSKIHAVLSAELS